MAFTQHIIILILISIGFEAMPQTRIHGTVCSENGDTLAGANVYIKNTFDGCSSDASGHFSFTTEERNEQVLIAGMIGYENKETEIDLKEKSFAITIFLKEKMTVLNTAVITAGTFETGDNKKMAVLNSIDIATTAGATADILGALKTLPGTLPAGNEDGLFVRGGDANEVRTYFDGIMINKMFTTDLPDVAQRGRFSPFMFKGTSFSAGGYSALYGQALSGVLTLESRDIAQKTKTDIGIMTAGLDVSHVQRFKNSSLEMNGAYYNLKPIFALVKQNTEWIHEPEAISTNLFYKASTKNNGLLKCYFDYSHSSTALKTDNYENITQQAVYNVKADNIFSNITYQQYFGTKWKANAGFGFSSDLNNIKIDSIPAVLKDLSYTGRVMITRYAGNHTEIKSGIEIQNAQNIESLNALSHNLIYRIYSAFSEASFFITRKIAINAGLRIEYASSISDLNTAPRLAFAYKTGKKTQLSFAYGKFYQQPADDFLFNNKELNFENATHYITNFQYQFNDRTFRIEAYYKNYDALIKFNNENNIAENTGYGFSRGIDVFWRDKKTIKRMDYWLSYSYLDTKRNYLNYPSEATPPFAVKHALNIVTKYMIAKFNTVIGATFTMASGRTYYNPGADEFLSDKTPDYYNFSINASYLTSIKDCFTIVYVSIENVLGIENVYGYRYSPDRSFKKPIVPSSTRALFIGMFITFGDSEYR